VTQGTNGSVFIDGSTVTYTPNAGFNGTDSFTYTATDGVLTDTANVIVTVNAATAVTVTSIDPNTIQIETPVPVVIVGSGFKTGASVTFENGDGPPPLASNVVVADGNTITATLAAKKGGPKRDRIWDLRVTNQDGSSGIFVGGLTVKW
jgi:hypothetical protein